MIINVTNKLIINYNASERIDGKKAWCELPYPRHKDGCPNYGKKCPLSRVEAYFDLSRPHWFAIVKFNLFAHVKQMKLKHPDWSKRQCKNVLYWQNKVRKKLDQECLHFIANSDLIYHKMPEAMGVDVISTMKKLKQCIEIKPVFIVRKIALIGAKNDKKSNCRT